MINATGILLNTGLGRAPLAAEAAEAVDRVVRGYCNLEFDLDRGERGSRTDGVEALLARLTGAEAAAVVNNNAAATILAVRALAGGPRGDRLARAARRDRRELPAPRDHRGLRGPARRGRHDQQDPARRLRPGHRPRDRRPAPGPPEQLPGRRLHRGGRRSPTSPRLARERDLWTIDDIGSGALAPGLPPHVRGEPTAAEGIAAGADLVLFSGDKLLGGPQCGILVGSREAVRLARRDPLMRALRVDKMTLAALEATLRLALDPALAGSRIPLWAFLNADRGPA